MSIGIIIAVFFGLVLLLGWGLSAPGYKGPETDHFNGSKFVNRDGYEEKGFTDMIKWMTSRKPGEWTGLSEEDIEYGRLLRRDLLPFAVATLPEDTSSSVYPTKFSPSCVIGMSRSNVRMT